MIATRKQEAYLFPLLFYGLITEVVIMTEKQKAVMELRLQGLCGSEIADRLGISSNTVGHIAIRIGLPFTEEEKARSQALGHKKRGHTRESLSEMIQRHNPEFEYAGGYTGSEGTLRIRCKTCGTETVRSIISVRHKGNVRCEECSRRETEARKAEREAEAERQRKESEAEKEREFWARPTKQETFKVCKVCGGLFLSSNHRQYTCGGECTRKLANRKDRRLRYKTVTVDRDITLEELYRRDKGVCHLCGELCDWDNITEREDGVKIAGDWYPSIDHVKPLAKGGLHSWDNVRLAHRICNYLKSDTVTAPDKKI